MASMPLQASGRRLTLQPKVLVCCRQSGPPNPYFNLATARPPHHQETLHFSLSFLLRRKDAALRARRECQQEHGWILFLVTSPTPPTPLPGPRSSSSPLARPSPQIC